MPESRAATAICSAPLEWPSRPGLATRNFGGPPAIDLTNSTTSPSPADEPHRARHAGRRTELAEHLAHQLAPLAGGAAGLGQRDRRRHHVVALDGGTPEFGERGVDGGLVARRSATPARRRPSPPRRRGRPSGSRPRRRAVTSVGLGERVDADDESGRPTRSGGCGSAIEPTRRDFRVSTASNAPPSRSTSSSSACAAARSSVVRGSITCDPSKMSSYSSRSVSNASTCCMRSDHCWSHGRGQAERLVPRRELHRTGPGPLRQRHGEHLEHDALHVVLRLRLGEPERVDLHAVAEPERLVVGDPVALAADLPPTSRSSPAACRSPRRTGCRR